jgi:hypothetical protein
VKVTITRAGGMVVLVVALWACRAGVRQAPHEIGAVTPLFGPVIGEEVISGRADAEGDVLLLAGGTEIVRLDLEGRRVERRAIDVKIGEECWGLARLASGELFTLEGRRTLAHLNPSGHIVQRTALQAPHFGLFAAGDRLIYQQADFTPPGPALHADVANMQPVRWSGISTRTFPSLARASVAALNMITCGTSDRPERACWFPDEAALSLVQDDGVTRRMELRGLETVAPEVLLTSDNPRRPVRDAYVDRHGAVWVLSSGSPPPGAHDVPGGWILAKYGADGSVKGRARLSEAVRLILRVEPARVLVLASSGKVAEVAAW